MRLAAFFGFGRQKKSEQAKMPSPAAAAYAPLILTPQGAGKLQAILDPNDPVGKPTRPSRPPA